MDDPEFEDVKGSPFLITCVNIIILIMIAAFLVLLLGCASTKESTFIGPTGLKEDYIPLNRLPPVRYSDQ